MASAAGVGGADLRLTSYGGMGVGYEPPHLRPISPILPDGFCTLLVNMHLHLRSFRVGLCHGIPFPLYLLIVRYSFEEEE